jgi:hypothetical protein
MHQGTRRAARLKPVDILKITQPHFCGPPAVPFTPDEDRHLLVGLQPVSFIAHHLPTQYTARAPSAPSGGGGSVVVFEMGSQEGPKGSQGRTASPFDRRYGARGGRAEAEEPLLNDDSFAHGVEDDLGRVMQIQLLHEIGSMRFNC